MSRRQDATQWAAVAELVGAMGDDIAGLVPESDPQHRRVTSAVELLRSVVAQVRSDAEKGAAREEAA